LASVAVTQAELSAGPGPRRASAAESAPGGLQDRVTAARHAGTVAANTEVFELAPSWPGRVGEPAQAGPSLRG
jgi:hypothetical protein